MASEIHTMSPKNMNIFNETIMYDLFSPTNYHLQDYHNFIDQSHLNNFASNTELHNVENMIVDPNMNYSKTKGKLLTHVMQPPPYKIITLHKTTTTNNNNNNNINIKNNNSNNNTNNNNIINNNKNNNNIELNTFDRRDRARDNQFRTMSPKGYESDENSASHSSRGPTPDNNVNYRHRMDNDRLKYNDNYRYNNNITIERPPINHHTLNKSHKNHSRRINSNNSNNNSSNNNNINNNRNTINSNNLHSNCNFNNFNYNNNHSICNNRIKNHLKCEDMMVRRAHGLMERFKSRALIMRINPNPSGLLNGGPSDYLNQSIWDVFCNKIQKEETYFNKLNLWRNIFLYIGRCLNSYGLFLVGSTMSGFGLEGSDIDMCLLTKPLFNDQRVDSLHHLGYIKHLLLKSGIASDAELIMAKVPILKFKDKETGFEVDLNCNNSVGIRNTHLLHSYARLDWRVRPLVVIVKLWAQANHINDAKNMTISSYSWALMVIHYLQCGVTPAILPCLHTLLPQKFNSDPKYRNMDIQEEFDLLNEYITDNKSCLGDLLVGFFQYYTNFNYTQYAISVRAGTRLPIDACRFLKTPKNDPNQWKCLCIEEPFDFSNTARSVFDPDIFKHIREIIVSSYRELANNRTLSYILPVNLINQR